MIANIHKAPPPDLTPVPAEEEVILVSSSFSTVCFIVITNLYNSVRNQTSGVEGIEEGVKPRKAGWGGWD